MSSPPDAPASALPPSRRRWILGALFAVAAWLIAGWWCGRVVFYEIPGRDDVQANVVGFAEDGSLITAGLDSIAGKFGVWRWTLPGGVRSEIWSTATKRATSDEPIEASISENRRWLTLSGDAMTEVLRFDLLTGRPVSEEDIEQAESKDRPWSFRKKNPAAYEVVDRMSGAVLGSVDEERIHAVSDDGRWVVGDTSRFIRVWRIDGDGVHLTKIFGAAPDEAADASTFENIISSGAIATFSDDSQRVVLLGKRDVRVWELSTERKIGTFDKLSVSQVSSDGQFGYQLKGHRILKFDLRNFSRSASNIRWPERSLTPLAVADRWWITRGIDESFSAPALIDAKIATFRLRITNESGPFDGHDLLLIDRDSGDVVAVSAPALTQEAEDDPWDARFKWHSHPLRFAAQDFSTGEIFVIESPAANPLLRRFGVALMLFVLPGWWCLRGKGKRNEIEIDSGR